MADHTRTEKIGGDSILFLRSSKSSGKPLWQSVRGLYGFKVFQFEFADDGTSGAFLCSWQPLQGRLENMVGCGAAFDSRRSLGMHETMVKSSQVPGLHGFLLGSSLFR